MRHTGPVAVAQKFNCVDNSTKPTYQVLWSKQVFAYVVESDCRMTHHASFGLRAHNPNQDWLSDITRITIMPDLLPPRVKT